MAEYRYEHGRRWNAKTPRDAIRWLVGDVHVSQTDDEVKELILSRIPPGTQGYTAAIRKECGEYAVCVHQDNKKLYRSVMNGNLKGP